MILHDRSFQPAVHPACRKITWVSLDLLKEMNRVILRVLAWSRKVHTIGIRKARPDFHSAREREGLRGFFFPANASPSRIAQDRPPRVSHPHPPSSPLATSVRSRGCEIAIFAPLRNRTPFRVVIENDKIWIFLASWIQSWTGGVYPLSFGKTTPSYAGTKYSLTLVL